MFYDLDDPVKFAKDIEKIIENDGVWCLGNVRKKCF